LSAKEKRGGAAKRKRQGGRSSTVLTEAPEMLLPQMPKKPLFADFWIDGFITADKLKKYGKGNCLTYYQPSAVEDKSYKRKINIYCTIPTE